MATIDSISGITKVREREYTISDRVVIGTGIDDIADATFNITSGAMRWGAGCTTTFTRCTFVERDSADRFGSGNWYSGNPRFADVLTCTPVFKGCEWIIAQEIGANPLAPDDLYSYLTTGGTTITDTVVFTTNGTDTASVDDATGLAIGHFVLDHTNIPVGTTITNIAGTTITLSQSSTGSSAETSTVRSTSNTGGSGSGFDLPEFTAVEFRTDENGQPCRYTSYNLADNGNPSGTGSWYNPSICASQHAYIDGMVIDVRGLGDAWGFRINPPSYVDNLTISDNDLQTLQDQLHFGASMVNFPATDKVMTIKGLKARNIGVYCKTTAASYLNVGSYIRLLDPVGDIPKFYQVPPDQSPTEDQANQYRGKLRTDRTVKFKYLNPTGEEIVVRSVTKNLTSNAIVEDINTSVGGYDIELNHWTQDWESLDKVYDNSYQIKYTAYGFLKQSKDITIETKSDGEYLFTTTVLFQDLGISETDGSVVAAYTDYNTADKLYDRLVYEAVENFSSEDFGTDIITRSASSLDAGAWNLTFDATLETPFRLIDPDATSEPLVWTPPVTTVDNFDGSFYTNEIHSFSSRPELETCSCFFMNPDGTKLYLYTYGTDAGIVQYNLSTAHDLSTATYYAKRYDGWFGSHATPISFTFSSDGTKLVVQRAGNSFSPMFSLSTAWDITTMAQATPRWDGANSTSPDVPRMWWSTDGSQLNIFDYSDFDHRVINTSIPFDLAGKTGTTYNRSGAYKVGHGFSIDGRGTYALFHEEGKMQFLDGVTSLEVGQAPYDSWALQGTDEQLVLDAGHSAATFTGYSYDSSSQKYYIYLADVVNKQVYKYEYGNTVTAGFYTGGTANTIYMHSSTLAATDSYDTLLSTGIISFLNGANTDLSVSDANGVLTNVTIKGINAGTEIRMFRMSDKSEVVGLETSPDSQASLNYLFTTPEDCYIVLHHTNYITSPRYIEFTTRAAPAELTVFQSIDRVYSNP